MRIIRSDSLDVHFNLAVEQYLLHEQPEDIFMLWRSQPSVVCGKHQNACAEANYKFCVANGIKIARRLSGGGTVFHDLGNINFTYVKALTNGMDRAVDYKRYLEPVRKVLAKLKIPTTYSERDDLLLNGLKISGNAQHIYQKGLKGLHHGTLLYHSDLKSLNRAIHSDGYYQGKSVPSNRSEVTNIKDWFDHGTTENFLDKLIQGFEEEFNTKVTSFLPEEISSCNSIRADKFSQDKWILGYSPRYTHTRKINSHLGLIYVHMEVYQDEILEIKISNEFGSRIFEDECESLVGQPLRLPSLKDCFPRLTERDLLSFF